MPLLETPSRVWRRIQDAQNVDMPSLPSLPVIDDLSEPEESTRITSMISKQEQQEQHDDISSLSPYGYPIQSTPISRRSSLPTSNRRSSAGSAGSQARFASSIMSRSEKSQRSVGTVRFADKHESFEISAIMPADDLELDESNHLPAPEELSSSSLPEALRSHSRSASPALSVSSRKDGSLLSGRPSSRNGSPHVPQPSSRSVSPFLRASPKAPELTMSVRSDSKDPSLIISRNTPRSNRSSPRERQTSRQDFSPAEPPEVETPSGESERFVSTRRPVARARTPSLTLTASHTSTSPNTTPPSDASLSYLNTSKTPRRASYQKVMTPTFLQTPDIDMTEDNEEEVPQSDEITKRATAVPLPHTPQDSTVSATPCPPQRQVTIAPSSGGSRQTVDEDATPLAARRKSFFLSVINSTARPAPRPRMSLAGQQFSSRPSFRPSIAATPLIRNPTTPFGARKSLEGATPNGADVSTASSHDLTTHPRANASFDPAMGAKGVVGRFNATKLNTYLHGLNRRLVEENEELTLKLNQALQDGGTGQDSALIENIEVLEKERDELEQQLQEIQEERDQEKKIYKDRLKEVEEGVNGIVKDLEERLRDSEKRYKTAATKLERAEEELVLSEERARRAEVDLAKRSAVQDEEENQLAEDLANLRSELRDRDRRIREYEEAAQEADNAARDLGHETNELKDRLDSLETELTKADDLTKDLRSQLRESEDRVHELENALDEANTHIDQLEENLKTSEENAQGFADNLAGANAELEAAQDDVEALKERVLVLEDKVQHAEQECHRMEEALQASEREMLEEREELGVWKGKVAMLERERERERTMALSRSQSNNHLTTITEEKTIAPSTRASASPAPSPAVEELQQEIETLEHELDGAHKEIARLTHLLEDSPTRAALAQAKEARIASLERDKEELEERVRTLKVMASNAASTTMLGLGTTTATPAIQRALASLQTPKTPGAPLRDFSWLANTPFPQGGGPTPLLKQIAVLERELAHANESVDDKIDKLEEVGQGVVELTQKLADAQARIEYLEYESARLERREERRKRRIRKTKCKKCGSSFDFERFMRGLDKTGDLSSFDMTIIPSTTITHGASVNSKEILREALRTVNDQLDFLKTAWESDKNRLLDQRDRLTGEVDEIKKSRRKVKESEKRRAGVEAELERAKDTVLELEEQLQSERNKLRSLTVERNRLVHDKEDVLGELKRTQMDMDTVKDQLRRFKQENNELEAELRSNLIADSKARHLQAKLNENNGLIDQLRQERDVLAGNYGDLQKQYSRASERVDKLRVKLNSSQTDHEERRHQLDLHLAEIEDLKQSLAQQASDLRQAELEKEQFLREQKEVARTVASLEDDLRRVKKEAETFGRDLRVLRVEKDDLDIKHQDQINRAQRMESQLRAQIQMLEEQIGVHKAKRAALEEDVHRHVCPAIASSEDYQRIKLQHNKECKGLMVQIRYLKDKFTRESLLRCDLAYQKKYLLKILERLETNEKQILAAIARVGYPAPADKQIQPPKKRFTLKAVAQTIRFMSRIQRCAKTWEEQRAFRPEIAAALDEVRKRRQPPT